MGKASGRQCWSPWGRCGVGRMPPDSRGPLLRLPRTCHCSPICLSKTTAKHHHREFLLHPWWWRSAPVFPRELHTHEYHMLRSTLAHLCLNSIPCHLVQQSNKSHDEMWYKFPPSKAGAPLRPFETGNVVQRTLFSYLGWVLCGNHCRPL